MLLTEVLHAHAADHPDDPAVIAGDRRVSFAQLDELVGRTARAMHASGVVEGDRVAYLGRNDPEFVTLSLAAMHLGAALVPLNWRLTGRELRYILHHSGASLLIADPEFMGAINEIRSDLPALGEIVVLGDADGALGYDGWMDAGSATLPESRAQADSVVYLMYTAGTTGDPKGAMITNANLDAALPITAESWGIRHRGVPMISSPLFHIAGIAYALTGVWNGGTLVMVRDASPENLLAAIEEHRVTSVLLVPAMILMMLASPKAADTDFSSLHRIAYGAAPISESVLRGALDLFGCDFVQAYGMTETTGVAVELRPEVHRPDYRFPERLRAAGQALPGVTLKIADPFGDEVPDGESGEVWIRTEQNSPGYWNNPEATESALPGGGWFRTGDVGYLIDGFVYINDRLKDMIISGGENVYSLEVENVLMAHPAIADCGVIGIPHPTLGETVKAVVVTRPGQELDQESVISYCRTRLAGFKTPTSVDFVEELPRNAAGKLLKRDLRTAYWSDMSRNVS